MYKKIIIYLIFIISLILLFISGYNIISWFSDKYQTKKNITKIYNNVVINEISTNNEDIKETENTTIKNTDNNNLDYIKTDLMNVDFSKLKKINNDVKGWIKVEGTNINYPFVQTNNNSYYLTHSFDKSYNKAGWVFLDYRNNIETLQQNTIIYAHGRIDYTMFGSLRNTLKKSWFNNKNNRIIKISTEKENSLWQVFSVYKIPTTNDYLKTTFTNLEFEDFINKITKRSLFDFNTKVSNEDKIITLSTCHNSTYKIVMHAKLIKYNSK